MDSNFMDFKQKWEVVQKKNTKQYYNLYVRLNDPGIRYLQEVFQHSFEKCYMACSRKHFMNDNHHDGLQGTIALHES